jgi:hypothetical protein
MTSITNTLASSPKVQTEAKPAGSMDQNDF